VTFEGAHVVEYADPLWVERAAAGKDLVRMLREGEVDAIVVGNELPDVSGLRTVFPDPDASAEAFWREHGFVPVNHLVTVRRELVESRPDVIHELMRMFRAAKAAAPARADGRDPYAIGCAPLEPAIGLAVRYAAEQGLLPRPLALSDVWDGLPAGL
jgi:4,5-dihydroxyphthalate decarboxylase